MPTRSAWCRVPRAHLPSVPSTSLASRSHRVRIQMLWTRLSSSSWCPHFFAAQTSWMPDRAANHAPMAQQIARSGRRAFRLRHATQMTQSLTLSKYRNLRTSLFPTHISADRRSTMPPSLAPSLAQVAPSTVQLDWRVSSELVALARTFLLFQVSCSTLNI